MAQIIETLIAELELEQIATRRVLERVPEDKLDWQPHQKSMSLGQLAWHVATTPGEIAEFLQKDVLDIEDVNFDAPSVSSLDELLSAFEKSAAFALEVLSALGEQEALSEWKFRKAGKEILSMPKVGVVRTIMLNHLYHHRGQLTVYLRLLDVPVPAVYGLSADEDPFAGV